MKNQFLLALSFLLLISCKTEQKEAPEQAKNLSVLEKIANAHGIEHWKGINEIQFSFNVNRDSASHYERNWTWKTKTNEVILKTAQDTVQYSRSNIDSTAVRADQGFINDKYWLLAPFNLVWDKNINYEHSEASKAPISGKSMQKVSIVYSNKGGYTPGDAYDFYFEDDFIIREWVFRKANAPTASLVTSWEDYQTIKGIKIAKMHRGEGDWKLYFTNLVLK